MIDRVVVLLLMLEDRGVNRQELLERAHTLVAHAGMG